MKKIIILMLIVFGVSSYTAEQKCKADSKTDQSAQVKNTKKSKKNETVKKADNSKDNNKSSNTCKIK